MDGAYDYTHRPPLTVADLQASATEFLTSLDGIPIPELYGTTDGKAVGTHVEAGFHTYLTDRFIYTRGSAASGIDFPDLLVDLKVTSIRQPQSSCPFRAANQKVYGLGYDLLVCVYSKVDNQQDRTALLHFQQVVFIDRSCTGDYQTTKGILGILEQSGNVDDIVGFLEERNLPLDEIGRHELAEQILRTPPRIGCLTISNALQWRLQYGRALILASSDVSAQVVNLLG